MANCSKPAVDWGRYWRLFGYDYFLYQFFWGWRFFVESESTFTKFSGHSSHSVVKFFRFFRSWATGLLVKLLEETILEFFGMHEYLEADGGAVTLQRAHVQLDVAARQVHDQHLCHSQSDPDPRRVPRLQVHERVLEDRRDLEHVFFVDADARVRHFEPQMVGCVSVAHRQ